MLSHLQLTELYYLNLVTFGLVSLLVKPAIFPETYAVIANVYPPATGAELDPPLTERRLEDAEYIELKNCV